MKLNFESIISNLRNKANDLYDDRGKISGLLQKVKKMVEGNKELRSLFDDLKVLTELIKDYYSGKYKNLTKGSIILVLIGLIYLVNPMDIVPDFILGGFIDDAAVIAYILKKLATEVDAYKLWKVERPTDKMDDDIIDLDDVIEMEQKDYGAVDDMIDITPDKE
ncbi:DUF1232 domain-containing protein [Tissierella creatinini]|nr:DUF1232 domain-containing protein [Tissierella creatinini]TJX65585.1 DUF1232 domain-containing protein [Soehngenia saccharolytica]